MRRLFRWVVGLLSALAVWKLWSRRRRAASATLEPEPDPADELRRKLAEARDDDEAATVGDPTPLESLEERRARLHAKAQDAIDAMHEDEA